MTSARARQLIARTAFVATLALAIDEGLKALVRLTMATCTTHDAVGCDYVDAGGIVGILRVENAGSALGFVQGSLAWVLLAGLGLLLIPLCSRSAKSGSFPVALGAGLMSAGALGNLFDRLVYGGATDFIALGETIVINPADVFLLSGMVLMTRAIWRARSESAPRTAMIGVQAITAD